MNRRQLESKDEEKPFVALAALGLLLAGTAAGQKYPILDRVANKVVQKYRSIICDELWAQRGCRPG
jgi:hypothetical protein